MKARKLLYPVLAILVMGLAACSGGGGSGGNGDDTVRESEPNNNIGEAQTITSGSEIEGDINSGRFFTESENVTDPAAMPLPLPQPNNSTAEADIYNQFEPFNSQGTINNPGDIRDWYALMLPAGTYEITLGDYDTETEDLDLYLTDESANVIDSSELCGFPTPACPPADVEDHVEEVVTLNATGGQNYVLVDGTFHPNAGNVDYILRVKGADFDEYDVYAFTPTTTDIYSLTLQFAQTGGFVDLDVAIYTEDFSEGWKSPNDEPYDGAGSEQIDIELTVNNKYWIVVYAYDTDGKTSDYDLTLDGGAAATNADASAGNPFEQERDGGGK